MATITIRNLDEQTKRKLQLRAALNGRSMEAEARHALIAHAESGPIESEREEGLATAIRKRFARFGGIHVNVRPFGEFAAPVDSSAPEMRSANSGPSGLGTAIHDLFAPLGGVDLEVPARSKSHRQIPTFE
jgi:plasmid stability protein